MKKVKIFVISIFVLLVGCISCDNDLDLPDEGSIEDLTPPLASFVFTGGDQIENFLDFQFSNFSSGATSFNWDFGDGTTTEDFEPLHTFPGEGSYTVTLNVSDDNGVIGTFSETIDVVMPIAPAGLIPDILEADFDLGNDSRDAWRNSDLGGVIQVTSSNGFFEGVAGAKLPPDGSRIGYQVIGELTPNLDYLLTFRYTFRDQVPAENGLFTVAITTPFNDPTAFDSNVISAETFSEAIAGEGTLVTGFVGFNSGSNTEVAIYFFNELDEAYVDSFEIDLP